MIGGRTLPALTDGPALIAAMILLALVGVGLIARAELAPEGTSTQSGIFGYLIIQAAGVLGLLAHHERRIVAWAAVALAGLLLANVAIFVAIDAGLFGPWIVLIVLNLALVFISAILGVFGIIVALVLTASEGPRRPPTVPAVVMVLVATVLAGSAFAGDSDRPPPPPTSTPGPVSLSPSPRPTATPTPTPASQRTFPLTVTIMGNGSVLIRAQDLTCPGKTCVFQVPAGTIVTLTPQAAPDSVFASWVGCRIPCQVRMDQQREVQARFRLPTLQVSLDGKAKGSVQSDPKGISCPSTCEAPFARGSRVTLVATPEGTAAFTGWTKACAGFSACELDMKGDSAATAHFETLAPRPEYLAQACLDSGTVQIRRGETKQLSVCFRNVGKATWVRGTSTEVELGQCCPLGGPSPLSAWAVNWSSSRVYADLSTARVFPEQQGSAVFTVRAPANAPIGDYRFHGFLVHAGSGGPIEGGSFTIVVTVIR